MNKQSKSTTKKHTLQPSEQCHPYVLLLPASGNYHKASIEALIYLAVEANPSLTKMDAIADEIAKLTNGQRHYKQPHISRKLADMNSHQVYARDKLWVIEKQDGRYQLIDLEEDEKIKRNTAIVTIPFNRTTVFRNRSTSTTIFGFKVNAPKDKLSDSLDDAEKFFINLLANNIFHTIKMDNVIYLLLDSNHYTYPAVVKKLNTFIDQEFIIQN